MAYDVYGERYGQSGYEVALRASTRHVVQQLCDEGFDERLQFCDPCVCEGSGDESAKCRMFLAVHTDDGFRGGIGDAHFGTLWTGRQRSTETLIGEYLAGEVIIADHPHTHATRGLCPLYFDIAG